MIRSFLVLAAAVLLAAACSTPTPTPSPSASATVRPTASPVPTASPPSPTCAPGPPVYHPARLRLLAKCIAFQGVVIAVLHETDGDHHLWISPDPGYERYLNAANLLHGVPALVAEIVPACTSPPADSHAAAMCPASALPGPAVHAHLEVMGPWVLDTVHGWQEVHDVVAERALAASSRPVLIPGVTAADRANDD
jgi:hypothetical protein